ncbi:Uncharacterized conserved protein [Acholeplasma oculi]|uniref:DUF3696 domain-containing protein n=1 Tax=Acholeplasma oculi TaxID=35623 RepID=A0A061AG16_9MOLU|nr:DUF3696 domain-containing protein [Acholeplasma oculi]CDR30516.1 hypothetical protein, DUF3696 [Acholeplasma oculi]SKC47672.1 Protein of unknown function [Acholeplasma oculi]SUT89166.1 Uncharacterized conserved protein [Acholeplasma oculi]
MKIGINNFKGIKKYEFDTDDSNITVLTGINSGGKTSFIQSLLMISQSIQEGINSTPIVLDGKQVKLGSIKNTINQNDNSDKSMVFTFSDSFQKTQLNKSLIRRNSLVREFVSVIDKKTNRGRISYEKLNRAFDEILKGKFTLELTIKEKNDKVAIDKISYTINLKDVIYPIKLDFFHERRLPNDTIKYRVETNNRLFLRFDRYLRRKKVDYNNFHQVVNENFIQATCKFARIRFNALQPQIDEKYEDEMFEIISSSDKDNTLEEYFQDDFSLFRIDRNENVSLDTVFVNSMHISIQKIFNQIAHIGPLRQFPESIYIRSNDIVKEIGRQGENANAIIASYYDKSIAYPRIINEQGDIEISKGKLLTAINYWLCERFNLAKEVNVTKYAGKSIYEIELTNLNKNKIPINNVGFGISQLLPILVLGLYSESGKFIIIEQPEIHLHPSAQSVLFDFIMAISRDKNIIVETHSDHFISRLRRRVIESKTDMSERIKLLFTDNGYFKTVKVDSLGYIDEWPNGFFDQEEKELSLMLKARAIKNTKMES